MSENKYSQPFRSPFSAGHAISSFRSLNFNPVTSICEIIDNSQEANATEIKIDFEFKNPIAPYEVLESPDSRKLGILVRNITISSI